MATTHQPSKQPIYSESLVIPVIMGAGIGLLLISLFVYGVDHPKPEWGQFWMVRPLLITPIAGAMGGAFYAFMDYQSSLGFNRTLAVLMSLVVFVIGLWLGAVLGLAGTMWS